MDTNRKNLQHYINTNKCVSLPLKDECYYLRIDNYLSEYLTEQEKLLVLDNLGITSRINDLSKTLTDKFNLYATLKYLDEYYVKKIDLYYPEDEDDDGFDTIKAPAEIGEFGYGHVDDFLSLTSLNPVQNRIITAALNEKADISTLEGYVSIENLSSYLVNYLRVLQAGIGIKIEGNIISSTLDLNPFIIVDERPETGDPNKIYLVPDRTHTGVYILYKYNADTRSWLELGRTSLGIDIIGNFLTQAQADERYIKKGESVGVSLNAVKELLKGYLKKSEVYTPDLFGNETSSGDIQDGDSTIDWNQSSGSGTVNITGIIDPYLDGSSSRAVANKAIVAALNLKQDALVAGEGILIENGVITSTFDTNLYIIGNGLPLGEGNPNKIYLVEQPDGSTYKQYVWRYVNGLWGWQYKGIKDLGTDLSLYLTKVSASETYMSRTELDSKYATKAELNEILLNGVSNGSGSLEGYATKAYVNELFSTINNDTLTELQELRDLLSGEENFALIVLALSSKANSEDVYTKAQADEKFQRAGNFLTVDNFNSYYNQILNRFDNITIDLNISAVSTNAVANKAIYKELQKKIDVDVVEETYVKKNLLDSLILFPTLKTINGQSITGTGDITINTTIPIDSTVSENSVNPVSSAGLYTYLNDALFFKLNLLTPGSGIAIRNNVISVTLDSVNPFIIADSRPNIEDAVENKLYLIKEGLVYKQYQLVNGQWEDKGALDFSVDLSAYLRIADANFVTPTDITQLRSWINTTFVKKADVYTPNLNDTASQGVSGTDISGGNNSGESPTTILPGEGTITANAYYTTDISDGITTNIPIGNLPIGTDVSTLKGRSFSAIFDRILFKETWPNPNYKHTITMSAVNNIVKVGTIITQPTITTIWNSNILPQSSITALLKIRVPDSQTNQDFVAGGTYDTPGTYVFTLNYSYPSGSYEVTSNFGNTKEITVNGSLGTLIDSVQVTYPWYINNVEQSTLVPINGNHTVEIFLTGTPVIEIPGTNSICNIQADLGLGYMDVNWERTTTTRNGVEYSVWTKDGSYLQDVKHKITFTIYNT